jgi:hypothetical protein
MDSPLRRRMSAMLCGVELTTEDVTELLAGPTWHNVAYHLRVLEDAGMVERIGGMWRRC